MIKVAIMLTAFLSTVLLGMALLPAAIERYRASVYAKAQKTATKLDDMFMPSNSNLLFILMGILPFAFGLIAFLLMRNLIVVLAAVAVGFVIPSFVVKYLDNKRKATFKSQILDGLMVVTSSLKAGLTLVQALDVLVEESSSPMKEEFSLVVKEHNMGASLEDSLERLAQRMQSEEIDMLVNSIAFAHKTGGNLAELIDRLTTTIRDKIKLDQMVKTLTLQGKLQGRVMSILPIVFAFAITGMHKDYFQTMLSTDIGKMLIIAAIVLEIIGLILIQKMSKIEV